MKFRRPYRFESLESRQMLNAAPLDSALLAVGDQDVTAEQQSSNDGWIRYRDSTIFYESNGESQELTATWPLESLRDEWQPLKVADFNGDGTEDILGRTSNGDPWLQIRSADNANELVAVPWGDRLLTAHEILGYGDVNDDALLDVISWDPATRELWVSVNTGDTSGGFGFQRQSWSTLPDGENELFVGDFNGDNQTDVLIGTDTEKWLLAQSSGTSFDVLPWGGFPALDWQEVLVGNFDTAAGLDIAALAPGNTWWVWSGSETGMHPANYWGHLRMVTDEWVDLRVEDLNDDGLDDIIGRTDAGELWVSTAKSDGEFHPWRWADGWPAGAQWQNVIVTDVIGDSLPDYVGQATGGTWWVAENLGNRFINSYLGRLGDFGFASRTSSFSLPTESSSDDREAETDEPLLELPESVETAERLQIFVNEDRQIVLRGTGQLINGITLTSASGSLVWNDEHRGLLENAIDQSAFRVRLLTSNQPVQISGEVVMGVAWQPTGEVFDLQVTYDSVQTATVIAPTQAGPTDELAEQPTTDEPADQPTEDNEELPIADPLDESEPETPVAPADDTPVVEEPDAEVPVVDELEEPINENPEVDPVEEIPAVEEPTTEQPVDEPLAEEDSGQEPVDPGQEQQELPDELSDLPTEQPEVDQTSDLEPFTASDMSDLPFSLDADQRIVIPPMAEPLLMLRLSAPAGGLIPSDVTLPFDTYFARSDRHVVLGSHQGATWDEGDTLGVAWNRFVDPHSLEIEFITAASHEWQSLSFMNEADDPPVIASEVDSTETDDPPVVEGDVQETGIDETDSNESPSEEAADALPYGSDQNPLRISLNDESYLVLTADGIKVPAIDFVSPAGGLIPGGSPFPFELSVASHARQVTLGTWGGSVAIDGSVTLDIRWNSEIDINDLSVEYGSANAEVLTAIIELPLHDEDELIVDNSEIVNSTPNDDSNDLAEFDMS